LLLINIPTSQYDGRAWRPKGDIIYILPALSNDSSI
jgi:hypothetical protein